MTPRSIGEKAAGLIRDGRIERVAAEVFRVEGDNGIYWPLVATDPETREKKLGCVDCPSHGLCYHQVAALTLITRDADAPLADGLRSDDAVAVERMITRARRVLEHWGDMAEDYSETALRALAVELVAAIHQED